DVDGFVPAVVVLLDGAEKFLRGADGAAGRVDADDDAADGRVPAEVFQRVQPETHHLAIGDHAFDADEPDSVAETEGGSRLVIHQGAIEKSCGKDQESEEEHEATQDTSAGSRGRTRDARQWTIRRSAGFRA